MAWHIYLIPIVGLGTKADSRRPKYQTELGNAWSMMDYGFQPVALVGADLDASQEAILLAHADARKIPDALDQTIGAGVLATVQAALEAVNIPAHWVVAGTTYRELLRTLWGFFAFLQRYAEVTNSTAQVFDVTTHLDLRLNQMSASMRQNLRDTAISLGLNIDNLGGVTRLRVALRTVADQWGDRPFQLGGITV